MGTIYPVNMQVDFDTLFLQYCRAKFIMNADDKNIYKSVFSTVLRKNRASIKITQEELAARTDIAVRYLRHLESGSRQPTISVICSLAYALETTPSKFMLEYENELPKEKLSIHPIS